MFEEKLRDLTTSLKNNLKSNYNISLDNIGCEMNTINNNVLSKVSNIMTSYGIKVDYNKIERILDETLLGELANFQKQMLQQSYSELSKLNDLFIKMIVGLANKDNSKDLKQQEIQKAMSLLSERMYSAKLNRINLDDFYYSFFNKLVINFGLYDNYEVAGLLKHFLMNQADYISQYFMKKRNDIISCNFASLDYMQKLLIETTDLSFADNLENKNDLTKKVASKTVKFSDCDLNYGIYHFTNVSNVESILANGLEPRRGTATKMVNDMENVSFSKGAQGIFGVINSFIYVLSKKRINEIPLEFRKYFNDIEDFNSSLNVSKESVCNAARNKLKEEAYIYIDLDSDTLSKATVKGLTGFDMKINKTLDSSILRVVVDEDGNILSAYDFIINLYEKVKSQDIWREFNQDLFYMIEMDQPSLNGQQIK